VTNIHVRIGDILESGAQTVVNTVNTEGVMGKGIALQFKRRFPAMYEDYVARCRRKEVRLGRPYIYAASIPWVINFPTKDHWRSRTRLDDIVDGLDHLEANYRDWGVRSLAVPPLGCGEGGLEWRIVGRILYAFLKRLEIPVELYAPFGTPDVQLSPEFLESEVESPFDRGPARLPAAWVAIAAIVHRIEQEPYRWPVGRMMFQKIAYFATEEGLPTNLHYLRGSYGPYADDAKKMQTQLVNNGVLREVRRGRMFAVETGPAFEEAVGAYSRDLDGWREAIERVADLFLRFNTLQAEIAGTAHFAAKYIVDNRGPRTSEMDVLDAVRAWKMRRKPPLKDADVARMIRNLNLLGWIDVDHSADLPLPVDELELLEA
jgi:O-acetyl-ADP-ribose deacetylase (regulator of RNase III)/uncharacterized protein YwgA